MKGNTGRYFAWGGFVFGALVSVAANVLAAQIPPPGAKADWTPSLAAQLGSAVWPLALLLSVEVLSRIAWPQTRWSRMIRYLGVGAVALFSAVISYQHIRDVLISWRYPLLSANVGPLVVDGLMVVCGYAMVVGSLKVLALRDPETAEPEPAAKAVLTVVPEPAKPAPVPPLGDVMKPLVPKPAPAPVRVNGTKPPQARTSGPTVEEIVGTLRERGTTMTKREIQAEFSVGGAKAQEALNQLKEGEGDVTSR